MSDYNSVFSCPFISFFAHFEALCTCVLNSYTLVVNWCLSPETTCFILGNAVFTQKLTFPDAPVVTATALGIELARALCILF